VAINDGGVLRHRAVCRFASACLWWHEAPWQRSVHRYLPWYDYGMLVVVAFASGYDAMKPRAVCRSMEVRRGGVRVSTCVAGRRNGVCHREDCGVRAEMGHAEITVSGREAVVAAVAMKTTAAAETPTTPS
jgi:hypothetical protein